MFLDLAIFGGSTAWKVSRYGVFSGSYFPVFGMNTVDTFHTGELSLRILNWTYNLNILHWTLQPI